MRQLNALMVKINSKPEAASPKVIPVPVPETAYQKIMERARHEARLAKHNSLVRRLLGDRANKQ
jgi:hypothetical protein